MIIKIACINCGEFFTPDVLDAIKFLDENADKKYLNRIPFPEKLKEQYETREEYIISLLVTYCPYCREVKFGKTYKSNKSYSNQLEEEVFKKEVIRKVRNGEGFQVTKRP